jgi:flagellar basal-body rod protein FlgB
MPISEIPIFSMLRNRMQWHQERQQVLAENVSNANTPNFKPRDLAPIDPTRLQPAAALAVARRRISRARPRGRCSSSSIAAGRSRSGRPVTG